jgi:glycosyltransferase 2 family protein
MKKTIIRLVINTLIGAGLIFLWLRLVPINEVLEKLSQTDPTIVIIGSVLLALGGVLRGMRLYFILPEKSISFKNSILITSLSQLLSFVIPVRLGEITKGVYVSTQANLPFAKSVVWIFLDRFIDFWVVVTGVLLLILSLNLPIPESIKTSITLLTVLMTLGLLVTIYYPKFIKRIATVVISILFISAIKRALEKLTNFILDCLSVLPKRVDKQLIILFLTIFSWIVETAVWYLVLNQLGINEITWHTALLGTFLVTLSFLIPAAPGYVGSLQASSVAIFSYLLGFDSVTVSAAAVIFNLVMLISVLIAGIPSIYLLNFDMKLVINKLKQIRS